MLSTLIEQGYGESEDLNCAEKILYGANEVYQLGLTPEALRLASGFGGGMAIGSVCGTLTAAIMVLGILFVKDRAHESNKIKVLTQELFDTYQKQMGDIDCNPLKDRYRREDIKCRYVIAKAAAALDAIIKREKNLKV
ncbi:C-GCAxxG-C-C family (seleno)protein [Pelosinus propionicus]|uniref:C_GCAxxG_C_C family probable redox protein n=1 Tax=Pelosinus propionicus DSM 13327 TaxID=1123291 RepID=A0A1I4KMW9_9FIRM|nr:C-GCAxxG-C-C family (seleno)protein [Pelosinus propionicus]SFL80104.1 C_GCAxxG_C_C family probable redox protein [Pelosinus propionicus DSM 13327]